MRKRLLPTVLAATLLTLLQTPTHAQAIAEKPPLGWNSWDSYGLSVTEAEWKSNVAWFHQHLQPAGWQDVVLDEGWYLAHPENAESQGGKGDQGYTLDANGEFVPALNRFPDGLAGLAKYAHGLGLKFGIHIIRGIPKRAVEANMPISARQTVAALPYTQPMRPTPLTCADGTRTTTASATTPPGRRTTTA